MIGPRIEDSGAAALALNLVAVIGENAAYLSEVDGAIGDGDHGINMKKGFDLFAKAVGEASVSSASKALGLLGHTLMEDIGGSMGPLYGGFFRAMGRVAARRGELGPEAFLEMLKAGADSVVGIGEAKRGDKTLLDVLLPAIEAFEEALTRGAAYAEALTLLSDMARDSARATKDMVAKVGRAARLGERSRGVQDAGATSCSLILISMAETLKELSERG